MHGLQNIKCFAHAHLLVLFHMFQHSIRFCLREVLIVFTFVILAIRRNKLFQKFRSLLNVFWLHILRWRVKHVSFDIWQYLEL